MPKSAIFSESDVGGATIHSIANGINEAKLKGFVAEIEDEQSKIDEIMKNAAAACQPHIDQIKAIKKEAAEAGIPKKPLSAKVRERTLLRKAETCRGVLSEEQRDIFDEITQKLGPLPLFQHLDG
jgi:ribosomal protein L12E/L44/L45/RPP1/RPP2